MADGDPEQCAHYAGFASHLDRRSFDFIYWFLFATVIFMLFLSSWKYSGDLEKIRVLGLEPGSRQYKNKMKRCMAICSVYAVVSVVAVVMEVFALMALQFCDGEDLMPLYWSTWTMMQVGSVIAILGIMLAMFNSLRGSKNPPWALALGTPVLVVAGIGHAVHGAVHKRVKRARSRSSGRRQAMSASASSSNARLEMTGGGGSGLPMSRELTLRADESDDREEAIPAQFLGFTAGGAPILRFAEDPGKLAPDHGAVVGRGDDGHVVVAFRRPMAVVRVSSSDSGDGGGNGNGNGGGARFPGNSNSGLPRSGAAGGGVAPPRNGTSTLRSPVVRIASPPSASPGHGNSEV